MRFTISSSQLNFFRKESQISFEDFYTKEEMQILHQLLDIALMNHPSGRDLERKNPPLLSALHLSRLGQLASQLFAKKRIRIAFTQYGSFLESEEAIQDFTSVSETLGGCLIDLQNPLIQFYDPSFLIDFSTAFPSSFLVVFATDQARYQFQEKDPHTHYLKKIGYGFGDRLSNATHPMIHK